VFEQATALERSDPGRASRLYRSLESGTDSWARNALYAHGRLEASRGNAGEARRLLERYLERFPRGSNAADARAVLERLE
jgi:TolA-binding protein